MRRWFALLVSLMLSFPLCAARREVFVAGKDRALWTNVSDGGAWTGWQRVGGEINGSPDAVAGPGFVEVFALGTDKSIVHVRRTANSWGQWHSLGGELESAPGAIRLSNGDIHVFARGTDAAIWHIASRNGRWGQWEPIGGEFAAVRPSAVDRGNGRLEVFARGKDNHIWAQQFDGSSWSGWEPLNDGILISDPAIVVLPSYVDVIALGTDARHWHMNRRPASGEQWTGWGPYDGEAFGAGHHPDAAVDGAETVLAIRGMDDSVRVRSSAGWTSLGGEINGDPAVVVAQAGLPRAPSPSTPVAASGVFRVTIHGFIVHRETNDDPQERDGARDEVFIHANSGTAGEPGTRLWNAMTRTFGDVHADPARIRAGSARGVPGIGADGGLMTGDSYPTRTPWSRSVEPFRPVDPPEGEIIDVARQGVRLPMVAWEGELVRGRNAVLILPAILEKDHQFEPSSRQTLTLASTLAREFSGPLLGATRDNLAEVSRAISAAIASRIRYPRGPDPSDRPIGMRLQRDHYVWQTSPIVLTYDIADDLVRRTAEYTDIRPRPDGSSQSIVQPLPAGVSFINWRDHDDLGGDYTLFWQIEKVR